jgi:hypothetical protein
MIPEGYITKYYEMDPATEDLLFDANYLQNDMVIAADSPLRFDLSQTPASPGDEEQARKFNRWFRVSHLFLSPNDGCVYMLATYADGTKRKLVQSMQYAWLVKKNSMPGAPQYDELGTYTDGRPSVDQVLYDTGEQQTAVFRFSPSETGVLDRELGLNA